MSNHEAWSIGVQWEDSAKTGIESTTGIPLEGSQSNDEEPDLIRSHIGIECKHRSGKYKTTTRHVWNGMAPKFFEGRWEVTTSKKGKAIRFFVPHYDSKGGFISKQKYTKRFILMDNIAPPTPTARRLLERLDIQLVTLFELKRYLLRCTKTTSKATQRATDAVYSFLFPLYGLLLWGRYHGVMKQFQTIPRLRSQKTIKDWLWAHIRLYRHH